MDRNEALACLASLAELAQERKRDAQLAAQQQRYIPQTPHPKQQAFLAVDTLEALYGGSAGSGKSSTLLMAALAYVHVPGYAALLLRRTYKDLSLPGALMDRSHAWLRGTNARWRDTDKQWVFPSGATLTFGYMDSVNDKYRYQGMEVQFVGIDELTAWSEDQYTYLLSRIRRLQGANIPLRMRAASNPGGVGHRWVKARFVDPDSRADRVFVPALMDDNPSLDRESYVNALEQLDSITRAQLLHGQWVTDAGGLIYPMTDANRVASLPDGAWLYALGVDIGASMTKPTTAFTVVAFSERSRDVYEVESSAHPCGSPGDIAALISDYAARYPLIDQVCDPGGMGVGYIREFVQRYQLPVTAPSDHRPPGTPPITKLAYRRFMRGDIEAGRLKTIVSANRPLLDERSELRWNDLETDCAKGADDHLTDSALYAYIRAYHYIHRDQVAGPAFGSAAYVEAELDREADEESLQYQQGASRHRI